MLFYLFLLFTVVPLVELSILIWIGGQTEWWVPIVMVIVTGIAGAALARWQGWQVLQRIREDARAGRMPADALIDGFLILLAGILLVTPGVLTDLVGVALLDSAAALARETRRGRLDQAKRRSPRRPVRPRPFGPMRTDAAAALAARRDHRRPRASARTSRTRNRIRATRAASSSSPAARGGRAAPPRPPPAIGATQ